MATQSHGQGQTNSPRSQKIGIYTGIIISALLLCILTFYLGIRRRRTGRWCPPIFGNQSSAPSSPRPRTPCTPPSLQIERSLLSNSQLRIPERAVPSPVRRDADFHNVEEGVEEQDEGASRRVFQIPSPSASSSGGNLTALPPEAGVQRHRVMPGPLSPSPQLSDDAVQQNRALTSPSPLSIPPPPPPEVAVQQNRAMGSQSSLHIPQPPDFAVQQQRTVAHPLSRYVPQPPQVAVQQNRVMARRSSPSLPQPPEVEVQQHRAMAPPLPLPAPKPLEAALQQHRAMQNPSFPSIPPPQHPFRRAMPPAFALPQPNIPFAPFPSAYNPNSMYPAPDGNPLQHHRSYPALRFPPGAPDASYPLYFPANFFPDQELSTQARSNLPCPARESFEVPAGSIHSGYDIGGARSAPASSRLSLANDNASDTYSSRTPRQRTRGMYDDDPEGPRTTSSSRSRSLRPVNDNASETYSSRGRQREELYEAETEEPRRTSIYQIGPLNFESEGGHVDSSSRSSRHEDQFLKKPKHVRIQSPVQEMASTDSFSRSARAEIRDSISAERAAKDSNQPELLDWEGVDWVKRVYRGSGGGLRESWASGRGEE